MAAFIPGIGFAEWLTVAPVVVPVVAMAYPLLMLLVPALSPARLFR